VGAYHLEAIAAPATNIQSRALDMWRDEAIARQAANKNIAMANKCLVGRF
jgi:hypothetical protein